MNNMTPRGRVQGGPFLRPGRPVEIPNPTSTQPGNPQPAAPRGPVQQGIPDQQSPSPMPPMPAPSNPNTNMPWLQPWNGPFAAPTSPYENQALGGLSDLAGNNFGLGGAQDYLNKLMSGDYLSGNDPNFQAIQDSGETLKQMEDDRNLRELQSRASAGGNALSGALMGQEADYLRGSDAAFQNMMAQLRAANYQKERGFQNEGVGQQLGLLGGELGGYSSLMSGGKVPRDVANQEIAGQYGDFLRQGDQFKQAFEYPDQLALATLGRGYPGSHPDIFGDSSASQLAALLGQGGIDWGNVIGDFFGGLTGGGNDGVPMYDGTSYDARPDYGAMLTAEQQQQAQAQQNKGKTPNAGKAMMIMALLAQALGLGKKSPGGGGHGAGSGGGGSSAAQKAGEGIRNLFTSKQYQESRNESPAYQHAWDKAFKSTGVPREQAQNAPVSMNPIEKIGGSELDPSSPYFNDPLFDPSNFAGNDQAGSFNDPSSPYYGDPLFDPNNFAGDPGGGSFNDPTTPYYGDPLFDPSNFADGGGGGGGDSYDFGT